MLKEEVRQNSSGSEEPPAAPSASLVRAIIAFLYSYHLEWHYRIVKIYFGSVQLLLVIVDFPLDDVGMV